MTIAERHRPILMLDGRELYRPVDFRDAVRGRRTIDCREDTVTAVTVRRGGAGWAVSYFILFARDTGRPFLETPLGDHVWDVGRVDVLVGADGAVEGVVYGPRDGGAGYFIHRPEDLARILEGGRPVVYVGWGKHAANAVPIVARIGAPDDVCRQPRIRIDPACVECTFALWRPFRYAALNGIPSIRQRTMGTVPERTRKVDLDHVAVPVCLRAAARWVADIIAKIKYLLCETRPEQP